jgi:hypothetical protein
MSKSLLLKTNKSSLELQSVLAALQGRLDIAVFMDGD